MSKGYGYSVGRVYDISWEDEEVCDVGQEVGENDQRKRSVDDAWEVARRVYEFACDIVCLKESQYFAFEQV